jgi:hypothetical protein
MTHGIASRPFAQLAQARPRMRAPALFPNPCTAGTGLIRRAHPHAGRAVPGVLVPAVQHNLLAQLQRRQRGGRVVGRRAAACIT